MDLLNTVTLGRELETIQQVSAGTVHLIIREIDRKDICQLKDIWGLYARILTSMSVVIIVAKKNLADDVITSNEELFKYKIGWFNSFHQHENEKELFVFACRVPAYRPESGYGVPCYQKCSTAEKQTDRVKKGLDLPANLILQCDGIQTQTMQFNNRSFSGHSFMLLRWLIKNYSTFGNVVFNYSNPLLPFAAILEGRQFISIVPKRKCRFIWDIDLIDFWYEQTNLL
jgi:hypothetical protein